MLNRWLKNRIYITLVHKFSLLFSLLYFTIFYFDIPLTLLFKHLSASLMLCIGIAGIGYLFNDYNDIEQDKLARKHNIFLQLSKSKVYILSFLCLIFAILPWFILPFDRISLCLVLVEFFLFYAYAFQPFRWKEKAWLGVLADAGYAHVIPAVLAIYTFSQIPNELGSFNHPICLLIIFGVWLVANGIRNILLHQIEDYEHDKKAATKTWIQTIGMGRMKKYILRFLIPLEWLCFLSLPIILGFSYKWLLLPYILYFLLYFLKKWMINHYPFFRKSALENEQLFLFYNGNMLNEYYEKYLPLVLIIFFSFFDVNYLFLLGIHLLIFLPIYFNKST
ncbi:MAG: UbiA family prenyltransferase [Chitinophagales bacterium]|nr:UbiA family prenyltransferase [Chitinophagales bacterium]